MGDSDEAERPLHESDGQLMAVMRQLYDASLAPRFQVLITQGFIDLLVNAVIDAKCKNAKKITDNTRDFPYSIKLLLLNELGLLSDSLYRALHEFKKYRNKAAHEPLFRLSNRVVRDGRTAGTSHEYCLGLIVDFYNEHIGILGPMFALEMNSRGGGVIVFPTKYRVDKSSDEK